LDGYVAGVCQTIVIGDQDVTDRKADAIAAAYTALQALVRGLKPGAKSSKIPELVHAVGESYGVKAIEDVVHCFNTKQFVLEGSKLIAIKPKSEDRVDMFEVDDNEVFTLEVAYTTGEDGKVSNKDGIVSIYKRAVDVTYMLKLKAARQLYSEINTANPSLPFNIRTFDTKLGATARLGLKEINEHNLLQSYPVLFDKPDTTIALFRCTCAVLDGQVVPLVMPTLQSKVKSTKTPSQEIQTLIATPLKTKTAKKKKAAKADEPAAAAAPAPAPASAAGEKK